jgi:PKD repeat protein
VRFVVIIGLVLSFFSCKKEPASPLPIGNFFVDNANCISPCFVYCYDQSYNAKAWKWHFGNSLTSDKQNDSIQYNDPGYYTISLTVWNSDNVSDSIAKTILIY